MPPNTLNLLQDMPTGDSLNKPILIVTCGLMGTGKSAIASELSERLGIKVIRSDVVRKELAVLKASDHRYENFGDGIYSEAFFNTTYDTLFKKAAEILEDGKSVIIDASFKKRKYLEGARETARRCKTPLLAIECVCSDDEIKRRLDARLYEEKNISDGRWEIYKQQKKSFEVITELSKKEHLRVNADKSLSSIMDSITIAIEGALK